MSLTKTFSRLTKRLRQHVTASRRIRRQVVASNSERYNVVLDIYHRPLLRANKGRYLYMLAKFFELGGCNVELRVRRRDSGLFESEKFISWLVEAGGVSVNTRNIHHSDLYVSDIRRLNEGPKNTAKNALLTYGYDLGRAVDYDITIPFGLHPSFYHSDEWIKMTKYRKESRVIRFLFAGNADAKFYSSKAMRRMFGKMPRYEALTVCERNIPVREITNAQEWASLIEDGEAEKLCVVKAEPYRIPKNEWLSGLANTTFFLSLPGVKMPMSHNAVEAMAMGCVPVLSYPEMFDPPLQDGINCLVYSDAESLVETSRRVFDMEGGVVQEMSENALAYYHAHCTPESFVRRLFSDPRDALVLGMPYFNGR